MKLRSSRALALVLGVALVGAVATGLVTWLYTAPANAAMHLADDSTTLPDVPSETTEPKSVIPHVGSEPGPDPSAVQMFADKNGCLSCHGDPALIGLMTKTRPDGSEIALYVDVEGSTNSVHRYKDCTSCHGESPHDNYSPLTKLSLSEKCESCHDYEYDQWTSSVHGEDVATGNNDPATCTDCHSATSNPHNVVRVLDPLATTYPQNIADTCAKCHDDPTLMDKYGIVEKVYESYMRSFHGKAIKLSPEDTPLQQLTTATCVNCHGAHNISTTSDPTAPVAGMDNLLETCQSCHPDAGPEFVAGFVGHKAVTPDYLPEVYWAGRGFYIFSRGMLAFGVLAAVGSISLRVVPWTTRRLKRHKKKEE